MKRNLVVLFFACLVLPSVLIGRQTMITKTRAFFPSGQAPADWHAYKLSDDDFSVLLPTVPGMSSYQIDREWASQSPLRHVIGAYADGVGYVIYVYERKQSLDDFISNFRYLSGGVFERDLDIGGVSGKAYGFKHAERSGATYFLATKSRIYVFQAQGSILGSPDIGIPRFLGSVKFGKNVEGQILADGSGVQSSPETLPGAAADDARIVSGKETTTKAFLIAKPEPTYTEEARQHQVTGTIVLRCIFRSSGAVTNITAMSRLEHGLTEKAIAAARQIRFIPAIKDGKFVSMYMQLEYNFNLY